MTYRVRCVLWVWIAMVAAIGLFPVWAYDTTNGDGPNSMGRHFIFTWSLGGRIDMSRLLVEWAVATVIAAGFYFAWAAPAAPAAPAKP